MYLMYADESGDAGLINSPTRYFALTGLVVHEASWHEMLDRLVAFRKRIRAKFGLLLAEEIHAGKMLSHPGQSIANRILRNDRLTIIRGMLDTLSRMDFVSIINIRVDKQGKPPQYDPFERAWEALIQRFENTLSHGNFPGRHKDDLGLIFCDDTDEAALRKLYRRMRIFNPVPHMYAQYGSGYRQLPLARVAEDPNIRSSHHSYFVQAADVAVFSLYQWYAPSKYVRVKGARQYFRRLDPVLCKVASATHPLGVVEL
jgi:hypothetical protein